jgi:hypothetical protein
VTLGTALTLRGELEAQGFETLMTRETDVGRTLSERVKLADGWGTDFFVSIHANSFSSAAASGTETYCAAPGGNGERAAKAVQSRMIEAVALKNRGVKPAGFYVLRKTAAPAILCELAFISNPGEERLLASPEYRAAWAGAICRGICDFYGIIYAGEANEEPAFEPYTVRVTEPVRVYLAPDGLKEVLRISDGVYTVINEENGYGRLKSGAGWLRLGDAERL